MNFDLYKLGPREFENLTQSIAVAEIGPFVNVFGSGPDGGREATFDGAIQLSSGEKNWDGYVVLQAKHKEKPASAREEASWLINEIRKEFQEWHTSTKRTEKPEYIIFATNVTLSPTPRTGGIDRVAKAMKEECVKLGVKDWLVWHSDVIGRFLEIHHGIRNSYSAWILPGDVLSALYESVTCDREEVPAAIKSYLAREVVKDRYANLDQAGSADDRMIPLAQVFIDLPIGSGKDSPGEHEARCLDALISACDMRHSPESDTDLAEGEAAQSKNRFVLVGGPGQGKSTVSQFVCQLYRALLVKDTKSMRNIDVRSSVNQILEQAEKEELRPRARRWPVKISLTSFADELAQGKCINVLDYIAQRITESGSVVVTTAHMRDWLRVFPWLIILDGLDEVPGSSNRAQVLERINEFQIAADEGNSDLVVVATTRPQGYTDEFSPQHFQHFTLAPLSKENGLKYGRKLAEARYGTAYDRVTRLMSRLDQATSESSTAHLMTTPLQVTIMAVLLDRVGKAPKDRYTLFADYYRVIYERELEKEGPASNLLRDHHEDINSIHADVGLMLQTRSERSGETESRLTLDELNSIITHRLTDEGHEGSHLTSLTSAISRAATDRLVFLVPSRGHEVSFEIRSLQEFWAADALMNCGEDKIGDRLRAMSISSHWRNVLLFALGNIFANRRTMRDSVTTLVLELNAYSDQYGTLQRRILTGSRLAVEIIGDGMVRAPRYEMTLLEEALKLIKLSGGSHLKILAVAISERGMEVARDFLSDDLSEPGVPAEGVLCFLAARAAVGDSWAKEKLTRIYDNSSSGEKEEMFDIGVRNELPALLALASQAMIEPDLTIQMALESSILSAHLERETSTSSILVPQWASHIASIFSSRARFDANGIHIPLASGGVWSGGLGLACTSVSFPKATTILPEAWSVGFPVEHWLTAVRFFEESPSAETLAGAVRALAPHRADFSVVASGFPWVLQYALDKYTVVDDETIADIKAGSLGNLDDWKDLERKWVGLNAIDIMDHTFSGWLLDRTAFLPFQASTPRMLPRRRAAGKTGRATQLSHGEILEAGLRIPERGPRVRFLNYALSNFVAHSASREQRREALTPSLVRDIFSPDNLPFYNLSWLAGIEVDDEWLQVLDELGKSCWSRGWVPELPGALVDAWLDDFSLTGLGSLVCLQGHRFDLRSEGGRKLHREWELIKRNATAEPIRKGFVAIGYAYSCTPSDMEDAELLLGAISEIIKREKVDYDDVMRNMQLDHLTPSRKVAVGLLEGFKKELDPFAIQLTYERLVRAQASAPTQISFELMRPC
ncbi:hypothetical protein OG609_21700 [Streptomyces sp. NBC_01224]|uniref:NACHT domain-containing protein n=1 Tax=Streptomyces sp. NBC_01224 TaxID=2903783 RepID=UPI002E15C6B0|nr:hypothetical protein OG609_21700 [Streptomyces sp. NBC_01224]